MDATLPAPALPPAPPGFQTRLLTYDRGDGFFVLAAPLVYVAQSGERFTVPVGFATDFDSTPQWVPVLLRILFRRTVFNARASVLHDGLYKSGEVPRPRADELFHEALRLTGETATGANVMWAGVRAGGWNAWRKHRKGDVARGAALIEVKHEVYDASGFEQSGFEHFSG